MKKLFLLILCTLTTQLLSAQILHDNGTAAGGSGFAGLVTSGVTGFGGAPASVLQGANTSLGAGHQTTAFNRIADDFTVAVGVSLDSLKFFAYQTGSTTTSTINDVRVRIFDGPPNAGGVVVYGDTTTNRLSSTSWSGVYRTASTAPTDATRPIMTVKVNISPALNLAAGTYWIEWNCGGTLASGPWAPVLNHNTAFGAGNAIQHLGTSFTWANLMDAGSVTQMGLPFIVYGSCAITATSSQTNAMCSNNGTGTITPTSGTGPYTYSWSNGQTTATSTGLSAGAYSATVTDNNGCKATASVTITQTAPPVLVTISAISNVDCNGNATGSTTASGSGGTGSITYMWNNNVTTATNAGLITGTYNVTVTDANACTASTSSTITQPTAVSATISSTTDVDCIGNATGSTTAVGSGGTGSITYMWDNNVTTATNTGLIPGTYNVTVTDANACTASTSSTIAQPTSAVSATISSTTDVDCNGSATGSTTAVGSGGTGGFTYMWDNSATTSTNAGLMAGTYNVTVTDANGCMASTSSSITEPTSLIATIDSFLNLDCNANATGAIYITASGGTTPFSYNWSNGFTTEDITGLVAATYTVTVTDGNGCFSTTSATITAPPALNGSIMDNGDGTALASATGGTSGYTYLWDASTGSQTTATATGLVHNGNYTVSITDANGCETTANVTVTIVGLGDIQNLSLFDVVPNPNTGAFQIRVSFAKAQESSIRLTNVLGQVLQEYHFSNEAFNLPIDLQNQATGVYFVLLETNNKVTTRKIIVSK